MKPELRFPEFESEWENKNLENIVDFAKGKLLGKKDLIDKGKYPCILYGELYTKYGPIINDVVSRTDVNKDKLKKGSKNQILIPSSGETTEDIATASTLNTNEDVYIGGDLNILTPKEDDGKFISLSLNGVNKRNMAKLAQGKTVVHLYNNDIKTLNINLPKKIQEQQKIGEFFSELDRQIELEEQKLAKLEEQKKGYMQKIFSQELGFKDENGNEYPTWQSYKLGNLYKKGKAGGTPKSTESKYYNGEVPFLSISDITEQGKFIMNTEKSITQEGVDNSTAWLVPVNSINYAMYASVGYLSINKIEVATSQAIFNMVFEDNNLVEYIYYYLNHIRDKGILEKLVGTGTQSNLSASIMKSMYIKLPDYEEMVKITDFLSKVDKLIEKQNQKIDGLKERKKGFLQKMFV